jgi:hypothetical protein
VLYTKRKRRKKNERVAEMALENDVHYDNDDGDDDDDDLLVM